MTALPAPVDLDTALTALVDAAREMVRAMENVAPRQNEAARSRRLWNATAALDAAVAAFDEETTNA